MESTVVLENNGIGADRAKSSVESSCITRGTTISKDQAALDHPDGSIHVRPAAFVMPSRRLGFIYDSTSAGSGFDPDEFIDSVAENLEVIQRLKLEEILTRNANVEYLQRHGLNGRTDVASFKQCLPVVTYSDLEPDILRLVNGDSTPIFNAEPISAFFLSTGTTSEKAKFIPTTMRAFENVPCLQRVVQAMFRK
jgi:hypothetical protein